MNESQAKKTWNLAQLTVKIMSNSQLLVKPNPDPLSIKFMKKGMVICNPIFYMKIHFNFLYQVLFR